MCTYLVEKAGFKESLRDGEALCLFFTFVSDMLFII